MNQLPEKEFECVTVNYQGEIVSHVTYHARSYLDNLGNGVGLEMVKLPGGMYRMGSSTLGGNADELPQHVVSVTPFFISIYPITQQQWSAVMKKNIPCRFKGAKLPVENISWDEAQIFCLRLSKITGQKYRLPTEAEWEYTCRAGTTTPFYFGETLTTDLANYVGEHIFRAEPKGIYRHGTTEVGIFPPNSFGVYDLHGNVWEWCADEWHDNYIGAPADTHNWESHHHVGYRVLRGGSWHEIPANCRSATRLKLAPSEKDDFMGFRVAI